MRENFGEFIAPVPEPIPEEVKKPSLEIPKQELKEKAVEEEPLQEPQSEEEAVALGEKTFGFLEKKMWPILSKYHMDKAESKLGGGKVPGGHYDMAGKYIGTVQVEVPDKFAGHVFETQDSLKLDWYKNKDSRQFKKIKEGKADTWEDFTKKSEDTRKDIRTETAKSYLDLRKAREKVTTPEDKTNLKALFQKQVEMIKLMHSPDYQSLNQLKQIRDWAASYLDEAKKSREKAEREKTGEDVVSIYHGRYEGTKEYWQDKAVRAEIILASLDRFIQDKENEATKE